MESNLNVGDALHGFKLDTAEDVREIRGRAYVFTHEATGARLLWLANDDTERAFSIAFKTPPADDTGVFHILEHSVLDGSLKYPVKEPFVELLKTSMATFINALTFPDKTMYPVSSTNVDDLENLMDVYLDAVFHPALHEREDIFRQEGWHLELESPEAPLALNGVVLNEMKGALADPDDVLFLEVERALFPDTCYRWESGGDPKAIPTLTYESYCDTHRRHYQPANAHVVLYGDLDIDRELAFLDERLSLAPMPDEGGPNPLDLQAPTGIVERHETMPMAPEHAAAALGFVFAEAKDHERVLAADILVQALCGSNEAPLKRAILDANLGDDFVAYLVDSTAQPFVIFELKGAKRWTTEAFRAALHEVATKLATEGIGRDRLEAAISRAEFMLREGSFGYPDGIHLAMASLSSWLYDEDDPLSYVRYEEDFKRLREGLDTGLFEELLTQIVNSNHACLVDIRPSETTAADEEAAKLAEYKATLTKEELEVLCAETARLHAEQAKPDDPEAIRTLPRLEVAEIGDAAADPDQATMDAPVPTTVYDIETHGIDYVNCYFDLCGFEAEDLPYLSLMASLLGKLGTSRHSAAELDTLIESKLGSFSCSLESLYAQGTDDAARTHLTCSAAALSSNKRWLAELPRELWLETDFSDIERIRALLVQAKIALEQSFITSGHVVALSRVAAQRNASAKISQLIGGIDYYRFVVDILERFDERAVGLSERLASVAERAFSTGNLTMSFAGEDPEAYLAEDPLKGLPSTETAPERLVVGLSGPAREFYAVPAGVDFVGEGALLSDADEAYDGRWLVLGRALTYSYLWNEVRVLGGAYGAGLQVSDAGTLGFYSFRDPAVDPTLERFDRAADWLAEASLSKRDVDGYIVACVGALDRPQKPRGLMRRLDTNRIIGRPDGWRDRIRSEVLEATPDALRALSEPLRKLMLERGICVLGQRELLDASKEGAEVQTLVADGSGGGPDASANQIRWGQGLGQAARLLHERARLLHSHAS